MSSEKIQEWGWDEFEESMQPETGAGYVKKEDHERIVESLRLSHEETTKQLRALEDAIEMSLTNHDPLNSVNRFESENICIQSTWGEEGFQELQQAIANSRVRKQNGI